MIGKYAGDFDTVGTIAVYVIKGTVIGANKGGLIGAMRVGSFAMGYRTGEYLYGMATDSRF